MIVAVDGAELHCSTRGTGPACLVLTNLGTQPLERMMPPRLSDRHTLVFVDLRGSGRSTGEPADLTFDRLAEDLEAVRTHLGFERVAVLGYSILGALAIEYGRRRPASVSHVIAVGTPPRGDMAWLAERSAAFFEQHASDDRKQILRDNMARLPPGTPPSQAIFAQTPMRFFDARFEAAPLFADAVFKPRFFEHLLGPLTAGWDVTAGADALRVPLLIALGRHDYTVPHSVWEGIVETLPDATMQIFERSGHQPFFEEPDRFATVVGDWMRERPTERNGR